MLAKKNIRVWVSECIYRLNIIEFSLVGCTMMAAQNTSTDLLPTTWFYKNSRFRIYKRTCYILPSCRVPHSFFVVPRTLYSQFKNVNEMMAFDVHRARSLIDRTNARAQCWTNMKHEPVETSPSHTVEFFRIVSSKDTPAPQLVYFMM